MALRFQTNVPIELHLRFLEGKPVESQFGGQQHLFTAEEGTFYVSDTVGGILADQLRKLNVRTGEPVTICKREVANGGGRKSIQWTVERVGFTPGEQPDGTYAVPAVEPKPAASAQTSAPAWADMLVMQSCALIDAYAAVLKHAARHDAVRGEDVRSIFLSTFINVSKGVNRAA